MHLRPPGVDAWTKYFQPYDHDHGHFPMFNWLWADASSSSCRSKRFRRYSKVQVISLRLVLWQFRFIPVASTHGHSLRMSRLLCLKYNFKALINGRFHRESRWPRNRKLAKCTLWHQLISVNDITGIWRYRFPVPTKPQPATFLTLTILNKNKNIRSLSIEFTSDTILGTII